MQQVIELGSERNVGTSIDLPKLVSSSCVTVRDSIPSHFASSSTPWQPGRLLRFDELEPSETLWLPARRLFSLLSFSVSHSMPVKRDMVDSCFREAGFTLVVRAAPEPSSPQALIRAQLALSTA